MPAQALTRPSRTLRESGLQPCCTWLFTQHRVLGRKVSDEFTVPLYRA